MAVVLKPKRSEVSGAPSASDLAVGEIAMNLVDAQLYSKKSDGTVVTFTNTTPTFFSDEVDLGDLGTASTSYDMSSLTGGSPGSGASLLNDLTDVTITSPSSGQIIKYDGSGWVNATNTGGGLSSWTEKTANYTASAGDRLIVDVSSSAVTITLPSSPILGDEVSIIDGASNAATNNITIARNGSNIDGAASDLTIDVDGAATNLVYYNATYGWIFSER